MSQPIIGAPVDRADGRDKVTGRAKYTADRTLPGMLHGVVVPSAIANGRIVSIDVRAARALPGVVEVMTHENAPHVNAKKQTAMQSNLFLLQDDRVEFDRQPVAVVVAKTFEEAVQGADLVRVRYGSQAPEMNLDTGEISPVDQIFGEPANHTRGDPQSAFPGADVRVAQTYRTPTEHHNPMETHGTIAQWEGDRLTLYDSTQWTNGVRDRIAFIFSIDKKNVRVIAPFVGGAFGSKGQPWSHVPLAAMAAKMTGRPVSLIVSRPQMFGWVGHRPQTEQQFSVGASRDGKLVAMIHHTDSETSISDEYVEPSCVFSRDLYAVPNYGMLQRLRRLNISKPTFQRAPGESTGGFVTESAMDELAYALDIDPLELRLRNYSERQPNNGKEYTSKKLRECYLQAAAQFGWSKRDPKPQSMRSGRMLVG